MRFYIEAGLAAINSSLAVVITNGLVKLGLDQLLATAMAVIFAVAVHTILRFGLLELPFRIWFFRLHLLPQARTEGYWISELADLSERPYSYIVIEYDRSSKSFTYRGNALHEDGTEGASWYSTISEFNSKLHRLSFLFEATVDDSPQKLANGYGYVNFERGDGVSYTRAKGFYGQFGEKPEQSSFFLTRLDKAQIMRLIGKSSVVDHRDMRNLIQAYRTER